MRFDILTIFPEMFTGPLTESIIKRAIQAGHISVDLHDIRAYATDKHRSTDDTPYGGGAGMVMKAEPLAGAIRAVVGGEEPGARSQEPEAKSQEAAGGMRETGKLEPNPPHPTPRTQVLLMSPAGEPFTQRVAEELAACDRLVLVCGRYEGIDERLVDTLIDRQISIGDYVMTGGELAAMVVLDVVSRLVPGVLDASSLTDETFGNHLLEYPQYTRPAVWEGQAVPLVLLSGHHGEVAKWRREQRLLRTLQRRPDLLQHAELTAKERAWLASLGWNANNDA